MISRISSVVLVMMLVSLQSIRRASAGLPDWVTPDIIEMVQDDKVRCMQEHGTTQELIDKVNDGNVIKDNAITCYMNCLFESFGVVDDETGDFDAEMLLGFFPEEIQAKGRDALLSCSSEPGSDKCDKMYNIATCVYGKNPEMWFML